MRVEKMNFFIRFTLKKFLIKTTDLSVVFYAL